MKQKSICTAAAGKTWSDTQTKYAEREKKRFNKLDMSNARTNHLKVIAVNQKFDLFLMI